MDKTRYKIAFVILTWNSESCIERCITSIINANLSSSYVYVVDNGSKDNTCLKLEGLRKACTKINIELIKLSHNYGTTISRNIAIRKAIKHAKYICILDCDTQINYTAIQHMIDALECKKREAIIGPKLVSPDGTIQNSGRGIPTLVLKFLKVLPVRKLQKIGEDMEVISKSTEITSVGYLMSACWLMPVSLVKKVGLLDEQIFYAPEDVEYCLRTWKHGYTVLYDNNACIIHDWQRLSRKKIFSKHNYEHIRGLLYLFIKYQYCLKKPKYVKY